MINSIKLLLTLILVLGASLTVKAIDPIKLKSLDLDKEPSVYFKERRGAERIEFASFTKEINPIAQGASFNPILEESQLEGYLNLIDSYKYFKVRN